MVTLELPYEYAHNTTVIGRVVLNGERPIIPPDFPHYLRDLVSNCWSNESINRPDFDGIVKFLEEIVQ